jgi:hypothetical protein
LICTRTPFDACGLDPEMIALTLVSIYRTTYSLMA